MTPPKFTPWTPEDDKLLIEAVAACESLPFLSIPSDPLADTHVGGAKICWKHVAKSMPGMFNACPCFVCIDRWHVGRDNKACRKRWIHSLDPKLRKGTSRGALYSASGLTLD